MRGDKNKYYSTPKAFSTAAPSTDAVGPSCYFLRRYSKIIPDGKKLRILGDPDRPFAAGRISGAKTPSCAIVASLLTEERLTLGNIPLVKDVLTILTLMNELGAESELDGNSVSIRTRKIISPEASYELVRSMRASVLVLGPLLARYGKAYVALPGGCAIGSRPIDLHIAGMQKLGAVFTLEHGTIKAEASRLHGADIEFERKTVGGTENCSCRTCPRETILRTCALEPEVSALAELLVKRGARIEGLGEEVMRIRGADSLGGAVHDIIPDRIEAGTFLVGGAIGDGDITLETAEPRHLAKIVGQLELCGARVETPGPRPSDRRLPGDQTQDFTPSPYPGSPPTAGPVHGPETRPRARPSSTETIFDAASLTSTAPAGGEHRSPGPTRRSSGQGPAPGPSHATDLRPRLLVLPVDRRRET